MTLTDQNKTIRERPILFSCEMVCAILDGRKTQTRRIIPSQPRIDPLTGDWNWIDTGEIQRVRPLSEYAEVQSRHCKFGKAGDRLWVRETFAPHPDGIANEGYVYRADDPDWETPKNWAWRPSIHMPRAASRITLEITKVRVERLNDITFTDSFFEGIENWAPNGLLWNYEQKTYSETMPKHSFRTLWRSINGPESWDENPWVWVITFKRIEP